MIGYAVVFFIIFGISCWFIFAVLGAVEKIMRGIHEGKSPDEIDYGSEPVQAAAALAILVFIVIYILCRLDGA